MYACTDAYLRHTYQERSNRTVTDKLIKEVMAMNEHFNPQHVEGQKLHVHNYTYIGT